MHKSSSLIRQVFNKPKHKLGDYMMRVAKNTLSEIDAIMFMVNVNEDIGRR